MTRLSAGRSGDARVVSGLERALEDSSVSVRITAAEGLFNVGKYAAGLPALSAALSHPNRYAQVRAAGVLDSQPLSANDILRRAIPALQQARSGPPIAKMPGIPFGLNYPFRRALQAIRGETSFYRW